MKDSKLEVSGMDTKWASLYLALTCSQAEITRSCLADVVPSRRYKFGQRPGIENVSDESPGAWKWFKAPETYTEEDKRRLLGKLVEVAVRTTFETHFYQWGGRLYRQKKGGAIGLRATGTVAKVAMEDWLRRLHDLLLTQGANVLLLTKYVDDILGIISCFKRGTRWVDGSLRHTAEAEEEDTRNQKSKQEVTLEALRQMANSLTPYLSFTGEVSVGGEPIPVLDTNIWYGPN